MKFMLFLVLANFSVSAGVWAQTITLSQKQASLERVFEEINIQTGYEFLLDAEVLGVAHAVDIDVRNASIENVLAICFEGQPLTFTISEKTIVVKRKTPSNTDNTKAELRGKITSKAGEPLPGVSVTVKGSVRGTAANSEGEFVIDVRSGDTLVFSFIGFKKFEVVITDQTVLDVAMEEDVQALGEVMINGGYYQTTDRTRTGNISRIESKEIEKQPVTSPLLALQGRVPGLEITPFNGTPGSAPTIRIRGLNSLRNGLSGSPNGNYPLYIVDGVPINSVPVESVSFSFMTQGFDPLATIGPENIESFEILKDADATAIYGSRGANGVILITTKKGKSTSKTNFDFGVYSGVGHVSKQIRMLNTEEYLMMRREAIRNDGLSLEDVYAPDIKLWDTTRYTNWQDKLLGGSSNVIDFQGTLSGGNGRTAFRLAAGYHNETMIFPGDFWFDRGTISMNVNHASQDQKFRAAVSVNLGSNRNRLFDNADFVNNAIFLPPNAPNIYDENGDLNWAIDPGTGRSTWTNPYSMIERTNKARTFNAILNTTLTYNLFRGLIIKTSVGVNELNSHEISINPLSSRSPTGDRNVAVSTFGQNGRRSWTIEPQLSYTKQLLQHSFEAIVGSTFQQSIAEFQRLEARYSSDEFIENLQAASSVSYVVDQNNVYRYTSIFSRLGYNFDEKYFVNVTGRRDGSSRFGPGNQFGNFGSVGIAWIFSNERIFKDHASVLTFGKVRSSYGLTGNDQIGDYQFYDAYVVGVGYNGNPGLYPSALYNPKFAWEKTDKFEVAVQLGFLEDRIKVESSWYRHRSNNQLVNYPLSAITGFPSVLRNFDALIENTGAEFLISWTPVMREKLNWSVSLNFTLPRNKLVSFKGIENSPYQDIYEVGQPLTVQRLYRWKGVNPETGVHTFEDQNGDGVIDDLDRVFMDVGRRKWYGGITNTISYKGFEISFLVQVVKQDARKYAQTMPGTMANQPLTSLNRWQHIGDITDHAKYLQDVGPENYAPYSHFAQSQGLFTDGSFIRLKTLSVNYQLPKIIIKAMAMSDLRIFLQAQNLLTFTKLKNLDPETGGFLPPLRMVTLGLNMRF